MPAPKTGSSDHFSRVLYNNPALLELNPADQSYKLTTVGLRESKSGGGRDGRRRKGNVDIANPKARSAFTFAWQFSF